MHNRGFWSTCALPAEGMNRYAFRTHSLDNDYPLYRWIVRDSKNGEKGNMKNPPAFPLTLILSRFNIIS
jgi:hypothetical protein